MKKNRFFSLFIVFLIFINIFSLNGLAVSPPSDVSAEAYLLLDAKTGKPLYQKNVKEKLFPASTTKLLTALLAIEYGKLDETVTITDACFEGLISSGSTSNLEPGDTISFKNLIYCLMISSANEAANAIAIHVAGSIPAFVLLMNKRAGELGAKNSHFANPHGLHDENHYTCAYDLSLIMLEGLKNKDFADIISTKTVTIPPTNASGKERVLWTTDNLISRYRDDRYVYKYAIGGKTGFTTPAGNCLVSAAKKGDMTLVSVILKSWIDKDTKDIKSFSETIRMFEWGFNNFKTAKLLDKSKTISEIKVRLSSNKDYVVLVPENDIFSLVPIDFDLKKLEIKLNSDVSKPMDAPIKKGQALGAASILYNGEKYADVKLVALTDVSRSELLYFLSLIKKFFINKITLWVVVILFLLAVLYTILTIMLNLNRKKRRRYSHRAYKGRRR